MGTWFSSNSESSKSESSKSESSKSESLKSESSKLESLKSESSKSESSKSESSKSESLKSESSKSESSKPNILFPEENETIRNIINKGNSTNENKYDSGFKNVIIKLEDYIKKYPKDEEYINDKYGGIENLAKILSDKEKFKQIFFKEYNKLYIAEDIEKIIGEYQENFSEEEKENLYNNIKKNINNLNNEKLYFHLHPIKSAEEGFFRNIIKLGAYHLNNIWKYGAMHASLGLNGMIIEWDNTSLVWPTPDYNRIFNFTYEIKESFWGKLRKWILTQFINFSNFFISLINSNWCLKTMIERDLDDICEVCVLFNKRRYYSYNNINCQFFVEEVLNKIGVKLEFKGEMDKALKNLRAKGELELSFKGNKFETRQDLDNYAKNVDFISLEEDEKKLLILFKSTFESQRLCKIKETGKFKNFEDEKKLNTKDEAEKMWKEYELSLKI